MPTNDTDYFGESIGFLYNLRDTSDQDLPQLHPEVLKWLKSDAIQNSLNTLHCKARLAPSLLDGVFCALLHSITCMHLKYFSHDDCYLSKRNLFVAVAIEIVMTLEESGHPKIIITNDQIERGVKYYC